MSPETRVERFPKSQFTLTQVEAARELHLNTGASSSEISEEVGEWVLTTIFDSDSDERNAPGEYPEAGEYPDDDVSEFDSGDDEPY
jgi:hypothetical protein